MDPKADLLSFDRLLKIKGKGPYKPMSLLPKIIPEIMLTYDYWSSMQLPCQTFVKSVLKAYLLAIFIDIKTVSLHVILLFPYSLSSNHTRPKPTARGLAWPGLQSWPCTMVSQRGYVEPIEKLTANKFRCALAATCQRRKLNEKARVLPPLVLVTVQIMR